MGNPEAQLLNLLLDTRNSLCVLYLFFFFTSHSHAVRIQQSVRRLHLPVCQRSVREPGVEVRRHGRLRGLLGRGQLRWGESSSPKGEQTLNKRQMTVTATRLGGVRDVWESCRLCFPQPLPPRCRAAPGISSTSARTAAASRRGGSATGRTTVATGATKRSAQVGLSLCCWRNRSTDNVTINYMEPAQQHFLWPVDEPPQKWKKSLLLSLAPLFQKACAQFSLLEICDVIRGTDTSCLFHLQMLCGTYHMEGSYKAWVLTQG